MGAVQSLKRVLLLSSALALSSAPAAAQSFNQALVFGDSNVDSGFYRALPNPGGGATFNALWPAAVAAGAGAPTSRPGLMNSEVLAGYFGLTAIPANQPGGTNYATSGAKNVTVNTAATGGFQQAIPTTVQMANYLAANGGRANPNALYLVNSGANDVSFALGNTGLGPHPADPTAYLIGAANSLAASVAQLKAAGARYFIVPDLPFSFPTGAGNAADRQARFDYSMALWSALAANGVNFIPADWNAVRVAIAANPAAFGFQFVGNGAGQVACTQPAGVTTAWALLCSSNPAAPSTFVNPTADQTRLFADDQHLTTAGQKIQGDYFYSLIVAPSQISYLAEVPVKTRAGVVSAIQNQIAVSQNNGTLGYNGWITGDISFLRMDNYPGFPGDPGTPIAVSGGFDYKVSPYWLVGAALSLGNARQSYSTVGSFTQNDFAASVYAAYRNGPVWGTVVGTAGTLHNNVNRTVPIGITLQPNASTSNGSNVSLAFETGYNFMAGRFTHGPLVGAVVQRVHVDAFTETGSFTSLAFADQTRNSAVSGIGYRIDYDAGIYRPFAKAVWNHEWANTDRLVTAFLTTVTAPGFALPVVFGKDWGTATAGTTMKLSNNVTGLVAVVGQFAQHNVTTYGVQVGLNVSFAPPPPAMVVKAPSK